MKTFWNKTYTAKVATVRISFAVALEELAFILAYMCEADTRSSEEALAQAKALTKAEIEVAIREHLTQGGQDIFEDTAIFHDDREYQRQFELIALKKFPEFDI